MSEDLTLEALERARKLMAQSIQLDREKQCAQVLLVPPGLFKIAERIMNTRYLLQTVFGNYIQCQYKKEKPYWKRYYNHLEKPKKTELTDVVRTKHGPGEYDLIESFHLPRAMRKHGYFVVKRWPKEMYCEDYVPWIKRRRK